MPHFRGHRETRQGDQRSQSKRSEEHTSELQSQSNLVCRLLLEKKKKHQHSTTRCTGKTPTPSHKRRHSDSTLDTTSLTHPATAHLTTSHNVHTTCSLSKPTAAT